MSTAQKLHEVPASPHNQEIQAPVASNWSQNNAIYFTVVIACTLLTYFPLVFPFSIGRFVLYGAIAFCHYSRTKSVGITILPIVAALIDVVPGLSLIPFLPSLFNVVGLVLAAIKKR